MKTQPWEKTDAACPPDGIYSDVPFEDYCEWDAINHSKLCRIDKSPLNCQHAKDFGASPAIRLGSLVHTGQLEPEELDKRYCVMPSYHLHPENVTGAGKPSTSNATEYVKQCKLDFQSVAVALGKTVVSQSEFDSLHDAMSAISKCKPAVDLLNGATTELSIVWTDADTDLTCKARIDIHTPYAIGDLKTSRDDKDWPLPMSFEHSLWQYNYYTQAAYYRHGWEVLTGECLPFWFVVVGTTPPMQCVAAPVGEVTLAVGYNKNKERLAVYAKCKRDDCFPGYESPELFELPERYLPSEVM